MKQDLSSIAVGDSVFVKTRSSKGFTHEVFKVGRLYLYAGRYKIDRQTGRATHGGYGGQAYAVEGHYQAEVAHSKLAEEITEMARALAGHYKLTQLSSEQLNKAKSYLAEVASWMN